jgi:DNA-binding LacI/PurR family transcriptional regulator
LGLRVPEDISIVSLGGAKRLPHSKVSSVVLPLEEIGATAVSMLQRMFAGESATIERLPVRLIVKDSIESNDVSSQIVIPGGSRVEPEDGEARVPE